MHNFLRFFTLLMSLILIGCGATLPKVKPYKMDIQQGNVVTSEMLLKLRPGMTKSQVKFIMGTPLLVDSFRTNRWDYFYQLRKQGKIVNQRRVILDFEDDLLKRVRGDVVAKGKTVEDVTKELEQKAKEKQSDEAVADEIESSDIEVKPMETPAIEATENLSESELSEVSAENVDDATPASVLAVPVEPPVVDDAPAEVESTVKETAEPASEEKAKDIVDEATPVVTETPVEMAEKSVAVIEAAPVGEPSKEVLTVMPSTTDDKLIFRMDRNLDTTRIIPQEVSTSEAPLQESTVQEVKEVEGDLSAEEPSFFERMLEKIGF